MIHETCVILNAQLTEEETKTQVDKLKALLTAGGAEVGEVAMWGRRKLAYEINKAVEGFYVIIQFRLVKRASEAIAAFEKACGYDDNVLRVLTIKTPEKLKGFEIKPVMPTPGYLADFNMRARAFSPRRRFDERGPRPPWRDDGPPQDAPAEEVAAEAPAETES